MYTKKNAAWNTTNFFSIKFEFDEKKNFFDS